MFEYKKARITTNILDKAYCDVCKLEIPVWEGGKHEGLYIQHTGGFYSNHDMQTIKCLLCDDCVFKILGKYVEISK
jgi:hypothetical protein